MGRISAVVIGACVLLGAETRALAEPASAGAEASPIPVTLVAEAGSPFWSVRGLVAATDWLGLGPRVDLVQTSALRTGLETRIALHEGPRWFSALELFVDRAFGVTAVSSWDLELDAYLGARIAERWMPALRAGVIGYAGAQPSQRGVVAVGAGRLMYRLDRWFDVGADIGWLQGAHSQRALGSLRLEHRF